MSCITLAPEQCRLLATLAHGPRPVDALDSRGAVDEFRRWGRLFGSEVIEPTGAGRYHAGTVDGRLVGPLTIPKGGIGRGPSTPKPDERSPAPTPNSPDPHPGGFVNGSGSCTPDAGGRRNESTRRSPAPPSPDNASEDRITSRVLARAAASSLPDLSCPNAPFPGRRGFRGCR